jgi:hypothetical protein
MKYEIVQIADQIMNCIKALSTEGQRSEELINAKSQALGEYDKQRGVAYGTLKIQREPTTLIPKIADGIVSDLLIKKVVAEESLKAHYSKIDRLSSQLNALQSVFRHLENTSRATNG